MTSPAEREAREFIRQNVYGNADVEAIWGRYFAPLLVEAERRGAEQGWREACDAWNRGAVVANPYRRSDA